MGAIYTVHLAYTLPSSIYTGSGIYTTVQCLTYMYIGSELDRFRLRNMRRLMFYPLSIPKHSRTKAQKMYISNSLATQNKSNINSDIRTLPYGKIRMRVLRVLFFVWKPLLCGITREYA